jgi:hypothetical protein
MTIQEQIINQENGAEYWKIHFEKIKKTPLTIIQYQQISDVIDQMIFQFSTWEKPKTK